MGKAKGENKFQYHIHEKEEGRGGGIPNEAHFTSAGWMLDTMSKIAAILLRVSAFITPFAPARLPLPSLVFPSARPSSIYNDSG